jgi:tetratricopeptide (TPR) repeat protein
LFLMGFVVEIILGRLVYFAGYIVAGLISGLTYVLLFHDQNGVGIGASGAIAGIMGMYLVLFGLRKIRFFYFLFVYFDYIKAPAIVILPFYILTQLFIEFAQDTNINVTAHLGGLLGGVVIGLVAKRFHKTMNTDYIDENVNLEQYQHEYEEAQSLLASMQIDEAREKFESLLKKYPADTNIKQQLFVVSKYNPASEPYHRYAHELLRLAGSDKITVKIIHDTFIDYAARAKPRPRWTPDLLISIAVKFAACGYLDDAEKLVNYLIKAKRDYQRNAEGLSALVKYFNGIDKNKMARYQKLLLELYPDSAEAFHVR